ncbi:MAG: SDR family NAD(P)-dependent oxidoreductase [Deltaproteobacteria bacterium]|nr:SDR family NAD(P)-dependent oxidoreductase [Deltaproteobacteria bacterium]
MDRLKDRVAIVTGSGQGMGLAIAHACAREGAKIVITDINDQTITAAVEKIKQEDHADAIGIKMDVTNKSQVEKTVKQVLDTWGHIDLLVNNAGGALNTPHKLAEIEEKHWELVMNVNLKGAFLCCQQVIPGMERQGKGVIVNVSALAGHWRASLAGVHYTAAKAGIEGLTRQLAYDFGPTGIRVNAVAPTVTMTGDRIKGLWDAKGQEEKERIFSQIPLRRLSTMQEIGAGVVFLASDESSYITGITLDICGGRYLR